MDAHGQNRHVLLQPLTIQRPFQTLSGPPILYLILGAILTLALLVYNALFLLVALITVGTLRGIGRVLSNRKRRRGHTAGWRPEDDGEAAIAALVGAGPRGPRSATDAKPWPEV
ncbi:MAG: hypothetical protein ACO1SV_03720 [Fimbriimonas sp.]